jgi:hypothetical protein
MPYKPPVFCLLAALKAALYILLWFAVYASIAFFWAGMELQRYGAVRESQEDAVIAVILTFSLCVNIARYFNFKLKWLMFEQWAVRRIITKMIRADERRRSGQ